LLALKNSFVTTDEMEERGNLKEDESSSVRDSEDESSSVGGSEEEESDLRVQQEVGKIIKCLALGKGS